MRFVSRYTDLWDARPKSFPRDRRQPDRSTGQLSPRRCQPEALTNLLVHRDLALRDQPTRLNIFDHSIELINPRRTASFAPVAQKQFALECRSA
mgnify:CR=1 FL=1